MLIFVYQNGQLMQVVCDFQNVETWAQYAAATFTDAIYFYAGMTAIED